MTQEGLRAKLCSPPIPCPGTLMTELDLGSVFPDPKYGTIESRFVFPDEGQEETYLIDTSTITGEWKVDRRPDPNDDEVPSQRELGKKRINELLDRKKFLRCRKGDLPLTIRDLVIQAVEKTLQTKISPPLSRYAKNKPSIQAEI